jgi:uncharacterized protein (TIGR03437 family)
MRKAWCAVWIWLAVGAAWAQPALSPTPADVALSQSGNWLVGRAYTLHITRNGGAQCGPLQGDISGLPAGFTWTAPAATADLAGTFTAPGQYRFTVSATCADGASQATYTIKVGGVMTMLPGPFLPPCNVGVGCMANLTQGGAPSFTARVTSGALPAGCELAASKIGESSSGVRLPCMATTPGSYSFQIAVTDGMQETASRSYVLEVAPPAVFYTSSNAMIFKATAGGAAQTQPLGAGTNDLAAVKFSVSSDAAWLTGTPDAGNNPSKLTVRVDPAQLSAGSYTGRLTVRPEGARPAVIVTVTAAVAEPAPMLELAPDAVNLDVAPGNDAARKYTIGFQAWNAGSLGLTAQVTASNPSYARPWLVVQPARMDLASGQMKTLEVGIDATGLLPGTYRGLIQVQTGTQSRIVPVTVVVPPEQHLPILRVDRTAWNSTASKYLADETYRYDNSFINVYNGDWSTTMDFTATLEGFDGAAEVTPTSGRVSGPSWAELAFRFDHRRINSGKHYGMLTITAPGARNSPVYVRVEHEITPEGKILGSATPVEIEAATPVQVAGNEPVTSQLKITNSSNVPINYTLLSPSPRVSIPQPNGVAAAASVTTASYSVDISKQTTPINVEKLEARMWSLVAGTTSIHWEGMYIKRTEVAKTAPRAADSVCVPSKLLLMPVAPLTFFRNTVDWPVGIQAVVYDDCGNPAADASVSTAFSSGDPAQLLAISDVAKGRYAGTWLPATASDSMSITLRAAKGTLAPASYEVFGTVNEDAGSPRVFNGGVVNNVYPVLGAPLAPGSVVAIYGQNLADSVAQAQSVPLPRQLGGTRVLVGGFEAPLFFVSPGQINAQIPFELQPDAPCNMVVRRADRVTTPKSLRLAKLSPGIAAFADGRAIAQHPDYSLVSASAPVKPGGYFVLYLVGMGPVDQPVASGTGSPSSPLAMVTAAPVVTIGGIKAEVPFAGMTPGGVGLYQLVVKVPEGVSPGDLPLVLTQEGVAANTVTLPVAR